MTGETGFIHEVEHSRHFLSLAKALHLLLYMSNSQQSIYKKDVYKPHGLLTDYWALLYNFQFNKTAMTYCG